MSESDGIDAVTPLDTPSWLTRNKKTPERLSREKKALDGVEEYFEKNGVLEILRNMATILNEHGITADEQPAHPTVEIDIDPDLSNHRRAIIRTHPRPIGNLNPEATSSPFPWKSRGVMIEADKAEDVIYYMEEGSGTGESRKVGGWRKLDDNPRFQEYMQFKDELAKHDRIYWAFSLSSPSFDYREGKRADELRGCSEKDTGVFRKVV